jgi:trimethylamine--corrinoid protein Co-methyltransferase
MAGADFKKSSLRKNATRVIDRDGFKRIHEESLDVLENVGIRIYSPAALDLLKQHGADVDREKMVAKIPKDLVEQSIKSAPKEFKLGARSSNYDVELDNSHVYFTFDGCGVQTVDIDSGKKRPARKRDIVDCARLANVLPGVGYFTPSVAPQDVPLHAHVLHQIEAAYSTTDKFVMSESTTTGAEARYQIEMASAIAGGKDRLLQNPTLSAIICAVPPLNLDGGGSEATIEFAKAGIPVMMMSMVEAGVSGPVTLAGTLVVSNAEIMAILTLTQCARKGAKTIYGSVLSMMEPRTGAYVSGSPEAALLCAAVVDLAKHYNLPAQAGTFGTNALAPGSQAATEHCLTTLLAVNAGADMINGFGLLEASTVLSFEQIMLDYDIVTEILRISKGIDVNDDTLAGDLIREVGIGGTFLAKRHTLMHLREAWEPTVFEYGTFEDWVKRGSVDPVRRANEKARALLKSAKAIPLERDVERRVNELVKRGEKDLIARH